MVNQNTLHHFLNPDKMSTTHLKAKLTVCSLRSPIFPKSVYKSAKHFGHSFAYDVPRIWNDLPGDVRSSTSLQFSEGSLRPFSLHKHIQPSLFPPWFYSFRGADLVLLLHSLPENRFPLFGLCKRGPHTYMRTFSESIGVNASFWRVRVL